MATLESSALQRIRRFVLGVVAVAALGLIPACSSGTGGDGNSDDEPKDWDNTTGEEFDQMVCDRSGDAGDDC